MDIEQLAREAGFDTTSIADPDGYDGGAERARFERFARIVAEQCAGICDRFGERDMHPAECAEAIRREFGIT